MFIQENVQGLGLFGKEFFFFFFGVDIILIRGSLGKGIYMGCGCFGSSNNAGITNGQSNNLVESQTSQKMPAGQIPNEQTKKQRAQNPNMDHDQEQNKKKKTKKQLESIQAIKGKQEIEVRDIDIKIAENKPHNPCRPPFPPPLSPRNTSQDKKSKNTKLKNQAGDKNIQDRKSIQRGKQTDNNSSRTVESIYSGENSIYESKIVFRQRNTKIQQREQRERPYFNFENKNQKKTMDLNRNSEQDKNNSKEKQAELKKEETAKSAAKNQENQEQFRQVINSTFKIRPINSSIQDDTQQRIGGEQITNTQLFDVNLRIDTKLQSKRPSDLNNQEVKIKRTNSEQIIKVQPEEKIKSCKKDEVNNPENRSEKNKEEIHYYNNQSTVQIISTNNQFGPVGSNNKLSNSQEPRIKSTQSQIIDNQPDQNIQQDDPHSEAENKSQKIPKNISNKKQEQHVQVSQQQIVESGLACTIIKHKSTKYEVRESFQYNNEKTIKPIRPPTSQNLERKLEKLHQEKKNKQQLQKEEQEKLEDRNAEELRNISKFTKSKKVQVQQRNQIPDYMIDSILPINIEQKQ